MRPTKQIYANYTTEDLLVWKILFNRQLNILENKVSNAYLYSLERVGFNADSIPDFFKCKSTIKKLYRLAIGYRAKH